MNSIEEYMGNSPNGKCELYAKFTIDDTSAPFTLHNVVEPGREYTISLYIKSEETGKISIAGTIYETDPTWKFITYTFTASNANLPIYFISKGIYYGYHTKLERYGIRTDWTPAPEDMEERYTSFTGDVDKWQMKWDKILNGADAGEDIYSSYITFQNGDMILGNSISNIKLNLFNDKISYSDREGNILAEFMKNKVALGMDGTNSVIDLCKGTGIIKNANPDDSRYMRLAIESTDSVEISASRIAKISAVNGKISATIGMNVSDVPWDTAYDDSVENGSIILRSTNKEIEYESVFKLHPGGFQYNDGRGTIESLAGQLTIGMNVLMMGTVVQIPAGMLHVNGNIGTAGNVLLNNGSTIQAKDTSSIDREILGLSRSNQVLVGYGPYAAKAESDTIVCAGSKLIFQLGKLNAAWKPYYTVGDTIDIGNLGVGGWITNNKKEVHFSVPVDRPIFGVTSVTVTERNGLVVRQGEKYLYGSSATEYAVPASFRATYGAGYVHVVAIFENTANVVSNNDACGIQAGIKIVFG